MALSQYPYPHPYPHQIQTRARLDLKHSQGRFDLQLFAALELTEEQKKEVDALVAAEAEKKLKELGFDDHAKNVIKRTNDEAKASRERAEKAEADAAELRKAEKERADKEKAEADKRAAEEAEKRKADESIEQRLKDLEDKRKLDAEDAARREKALQDKFASELSVRDKELVVEAVRAEAVSRGVLDDVKDDVPKLFDLSKVEVENGRVKRDTVTALLDEMVEKRPGLFKKPATDDERERDADGRFVRRPTPTSKSSDVDAAGMNQGEFSKLEEKLRRGRA